MKHIDFYFDPLSPYAYLAFELLPQTLEGISHSVSYHPVLLAAVLQHWGQKGPIQIPPKRAWAGRHLRWLAKRHGVPLWFPAELPFNPLPLLRLAVACAPAGGTPNRWVVETLFHHVWRAKGQSGPLDDARLAALQAQLAPQSALDLRQAAQDPAIKAALAASTDAAIQRGVFGVPAMVMDGELFWGVESLEMLADQAGGKCAI